MITNDMDWISVKDNLPLEDGIYEVCYERTEISERCCGREWFISGEWVPGPIHCHLAIIYWMSLPQPPKELMSETSFQCRNFEDSKRCEYPMLRENIGDAFDYPFCEYCQIKNYGKITRLNNGILSKPPKE